MTIDLSDVTLGKGSHKAVDGVCLLEATALFAGELKTDRPSCVSPVIRDFGISLNDLMPDELRQQLIPFVKRMIGTNGDGYDQQRAYMLADWAVRVIAPISLEAKGLIEAAQRLRNLSPIVDVHTARIAANAANDANATNATYDDAAGAAYHAAHAAAHAANAANAANATYYAAYYAANAAEVWNSAIEMFDKIISVGE